jgi:hypothetical protein
MRHTSHLAVLAAALCCAAAHAGDVYKYVDERGNTLYTDRPLPGAVLVSSGNPKPPEAAARAYANQQAAQNSQLASTNQRIAEARTNSNATATVAKDLEASRLERCAKARERYQAAINSQRLYRTAEDGSRVYLTDEELAQARVEALKQAEAICGPQG